MFKKNYYYNYSNNEILSSIKDKEIFFTLFTISFFFFFFFYFKIYLNLPYKQYRYYKEILSLSWINEHDESRKVQGYYISRLFLSYRFFFSTLHSKLIESLFRSDVVVK